MKKIFVSLFILSLFYMVQPVFAQEVVAPANKQVVNNVDFSKSYKTNSENLLYLLLAAINEHNYLIEEIQFKTGSVLFKAYTKEFIASVSAQDGYNSFVKIIPADNNYNFSPALIEKLHSYIELNNNISFQKIL
ncbi:MAG: hypothetical protein E7Z90_01415 [Cyanobacteria bacterium SIG29]|nr:hypothetical protein [Cyanobacteria bacterium SIG29]